jgi:hypothetical protein
MRALDTASRPPVVFVQLGNFVRDLRSKLYLLFALGSAAG